jgi:hypothetical protein
VIPRRVDQPSRQITALVRHSVMLHTQPGPPRSAVGAEWEQRSAARCGQARSDAAIAPIKEAPTCGNVHEQRLCSPTRSVRDEERPFQANLVAGSRSIPGPLTIRHHLPFRRSGGVIPLPLDSRPSNGQVTCIPGHACGPIYDSTAKQRIGPALLPPLLRTNLHSSQRDTGRSVRCTRAI